MEIENLNIDFAALVERMKGANGGITIKDRKYLGKTFERSFSGKEAVEWFMKNIPNITEDQSILVGKSLLTKKYIKHATTRKGFANTHLIFQFSQPPTRGACGYSETSISDLAPDELFEVFQITVREGMFRERPGLRAFIVHKPTATGTEALDWLSRRFAVSRGRAREVATQLVTNKFMSSICGSLDFSESRWYLPTNIEFLNAIDRAEDLLLPNLVLTGFQISYIPSRLADLPHIKTLDLSTNNISQVCGNISTLPVLEDLILANNHIEYITSEISNLRSLRKLDLHNNSLSCLSPAIAKLPLLETLILDNNNIVELPHEFSTLSKLKVLSMTNNQLKEIPDCVSGMHNLQVLNLQNNKEISSIPAFIAGLNELQEIRLDNNNIEQIPAFLGGLPKIKFIGLNGNNKIQCPPKSVIELGSEGIINYLKDLQSSTVPCFCGKMLILGMENVGKTSLLQAIQAPDKKFLRSPRVSKAKNLSTDGISISCVTLDSYLKEAPTEGPFITEKGLFGKKIIERLNLSIWDFAGQDTYYTTHEFFLTDNAIYTVVWDIRKDPEESRVDFWLKSIQARAPNAPVILVATHVDLVEKNKINDLLSAVEAKYIKKYPQIALIECVSTYSLEGMKEFKKDLRKLAMQQPFIRSRIPGKHYGLAQAVVDERRTRNPPIASWEEYQEIAKLVFINEPKSLDLVTRHLHELGFLMHFREESLKNTVILSPQWLSDCFSSIITVKNTFCKNGRLPLKSLPLIWKSDSFPISLQGKLLRMLEIFEVLFIMRKPNIPENELEAIVPSLLPSEQPKNLLQTWDSILLEEKEKEKDLDGAEQKEEEHIFKRKFEFSFITRAFFSRLLVRLLHVGEPLEYWRHGIINKKKGAAGLIRFEPVDCILDISVKCNKFDAGADLFSVILDNVNTLISDWPKVNARVTIPCVCSVACHTSPHQFQIQEIENMLLVQAGYLTCPKTGINVCLDGLAPDLSLANLKGNKIDPAEITGLEPIGSGSFADVFKAGFKGEVVAVKQLTLEDGDSRSIRFSDLTSSESLTSGSFSSSFSSSSLNDSLTSNMSDLSINNSLNNTQNNTQNNNNDSRSFGHSVSLSSLKSTSQKSVSDTMLDYLHEFRREVVLMSTLQHENIVNMKGFCYEPYSIIMEYMDQGSLTTYVKNNRNNEWNVKLNLALDIARGMKFLHNTSPPLVHRDLKSPNVLLKAIPQAPFIQAKISDFGLSRTLVSGFVSKVVDNPRWCAPEIIKKTEYDEKSDVYSFGIILWELLTGEHPFAEFDIKWTHVLEDKIVQEHLRPTIPDNCPSDFSDLIKQSWADSPKTRPSFVEIVSTLEGMLQAL